MSINTFDIITEYRALEELLNEVDAETGEFINSEEDIKEYISRLNDTRENKLNNIEDLKLDFKGKIEALKTKINKLTAREKSFESNIERLRGLQELLLNGEKLKTDEYTFSFRKSKSVEITDINLIEDKYCTFEKKANRAEIKKAIEKAIENNESFFGAEIVEKTSLSVR